MITPKYTYTKPERVEINGKRHYCLPDGSKVPSVTTILDATQSPEKIAALEAWRKRMGAAKAKEITTIAASRGTRMHKYLEDYVLTDTLNPAGTNPFSMQSRRMADTIIKNAMHNITEYWGSEVPVYYSGLYAGTSDCVGVWKGSPAILDFKQTNKPKKREYIDSYFLQLAAYALAHNNMHGTDIKTGVILMCSAPETPADEPVYQEFVVELAEFELYANKWWDMVEQYFASH